jgi:acyl dehydratase
MSISFEDLQVGQRWQSTGRTLTDADLTIACMTSGDWHPIHADAEFAKQSIGGQRIFHGTYGLHIAMALSTKFPDLGSDVVGALGFSEWRFRTPLLIGDTVHVEVEIAAKRITTDPGRGLLERRITLKKGDGTVAQEGVALLMARCGHGKS